MEFSVEPLHFADNLDSLVVKARGTANLERY